LKTDTSILMPRMVACTAAISWASLVFASDVAKAGEPFEGQNLVTRANSSTTDLIELDGTIVQSWHGTGTPASMAYLLDDDSIVRPSRHTSIFFNAGGVGGRIQRIDSSDTVVWDYIFATADYQQHHDIEPMPNGNVLLIAWERRSNAEAVAAGRTGSFNEMWPTYIVELEPTGATTADLAWEWRAWDHLIQDSDPGKPNFGVVADHPERLDINFGTLGNGDWIHANSIDYDPERDQIVFSSRSLNEVYVIDHSTTTAEAAGSTGGNSGMGGDFLYRWGNPQAYDRGTSGDQYLSVVHGANWIDEGTPGAGNILLFNNGNRPGSANDYSTVVELVPPRNPDGTYAIGDGLPFGPAAPVWTYGEPGDYYGGPIQCGAYRLPNGNTLVTIYGLGQLREVNPDGDIVWTYTVSGGVNRAQRYSDLESTGIEGDIAESGLQLLPNSPNPFQSATSLGFVLPSDTEVELGIFAVTGRRIATLATGLQRAGELRVSWDGRDEEGRAMPSGVYLARLEAGSDVIVRSVVLQK